MPDDGDAPRRHRVLGKGRMEGFSDGVFGFAITLLVLDIALHPPGTPLQQVLHAWPSYLAYVTSFLTIGGAWLLHTGLTDQLARTDPIFLRLNLLVLLVVVFLPFPTHLVAEALHQTRGERVYVTMYGLALLVIRLLGPPSVPTRGASISTRRTKTTRRCTQTGGNSCPWLSGT